MIDLHRVLWLASSIQGMSDQRPTSLKALPSACDPLGLYYRFFYELSHLYTPERGADVVDIGTYAGTSAAHLAGNPAVRVTTVDVDPEAKKRMDRIGMLNVVAVTSESVEFARGLAAKGVSRHFDIAFIDGEHTLAQAWKDYEAFRPLMKDGGLMFFDDIHLPMSSDKMETFWERIPHPKADLSSLHYTGFGVAKVRH